MDASVRCMFPELGVVIGYAATATIRAAAPGEESQPRAVAAHLVRCREPRLVVIQDLDDPRGVGSYWGEVNANIHQAFGAHGVITNGCVRDLDEMREVGFHAFARSVGVSHAYVHVVEVGIPVTVGGLDVHPGDLLLGRPARGDLDPPRDRRALPEAIRKVEADEQNIITMFRSPDFDPKSFIGDARALKRV